MKRTFRAWQHIFELKKFDLTQDSHYITAAEIKRITNIEARIMAKMDSFSDLPPIFKDNGYFLLPVQNGTYVIVKGQGFHSLEPKVNYQRYLSQIRFPLTTAGRGSGEMQYLDYAYNTGAIENLINCGPLYQSIRGREFSKKFWFNVNSTKLWVESVQLEVDSGLEGHDCIVLIEAKIGVPDDFIIRQLFYPYRHFQEISPKKKIIPAFFTYEPNTEQYNFWIYEISNPTDYNSIKLLERKSFKIVSARELSLKDMKPKGIAVYKDLIPQANDLDKVIEFIFKVDEGLDNYSSVAEYFQFDKRQSSYYREAAEALGFIYLDKGRYYLTEAGEHLVSLPLKDRNIFFIDILLDFNLVRAGIDILKERKILTKQDTEQLVESHSNLTGTTVGRRAESLRSWYKWIAEATGTFTYEGTTFRLSS